MAALRLAAWFWWMTPLLAALSSSREALRKAVCALVASPPSAASRNLRTAVLSSDFTALLRRRRRSFCPMRLICDLMLATRVLPQDRRVGIQRSRLPAGALGQPTQRDLTLRRLERPHRRQPRRRRLRREPGQHAGERGDDSRDR